MIRNRYLRMERTTRSRHRAACLCRHIERRIMRRAHDDYVLLKSTIPTAKDWDRAQAALEKELSIFEWVKRKMRFLTK